MMINNQYPKSKNQTPSLEFGYWDLFGNCDLVIGI